MIFYFIYVYEKVNKKNIKKINVYIYYLYLIQYMQMAAAPQLSVASYKPDAVNQVQPRGISMMVSGETGVPYGTMMPQLATLQIGNSVS